jgi:hypothetical protein
MGSSVDTRKIPSNGLTVLGLVGQCIAVARHVRSALVREMSEGVEGLYWIQRRGVCSRSWDRGYVHLVMFRMMNSDLGTGKGWRIPGIALILRCSAPPTSQGVLYQHIWIVSRNLHPAHTIPSHLSLFHVGIHYDSL